MESCCDLREHATDSIGQVILKNTWCKIHFCLYPARWSLDKKETGLLYCIASIAVLFVIQDYFRESGFRSNAGFHP